MGLKTTRRGLLLAVGVLTLAFGGTRLVVDEVQLAGHRARTRGLEQRAEGAARDRQRLVRLEQELERALQETATLDADFEARTREVEDLQSALRASQEDFEKLEGRSRDERERLEEALEESRRLEAERADALEALQEVAAERARVLQTVQALAEERAQALTEARRLSEAQERSLVRRGEAIDALRGDLQAAEDRAESSEDLIARLEAAGVNVARLSGQRPMPRIFAVIVRVDGDAVPLLVLVDAGRGSGLEAQDTLYVVRDGRQVATLEVEEVGEQVSSARLVRGQRGLRLRPGEDVSSVRPGVSPP